MRDHTAPQAQPLYQRLRAWRDGQLLPGIDVAWARPEPVPARTTCQYRGEASYFRVRDSEFP